MNDKVSNKEPLGANERISAIMDGALEGDLGPLARSTAFLETWRRYHLYGDAIRGQMPARLDLDLPGRVRAALAGEKAHVADPAI